METFPSFPASALGRHNRRSRPAIAERILAAWLGGVRAGRLSVEFPSGKRRTFEGAAPGPHALVRIHDLRLVARMAFGGDIGIAESYMAGEWDSPDLMAVLAFGSVNASAVAGALGRSWPAAVLSRVRHARRTNTRTGSRRNIAAHYDLGNAFFGRWLDETMTYSSALFADPDEPFVEAQRRKYRRLAEVLHLRPGDRVLELGCGWGGFAELAAAEYRCEVVALTVSAEQAAYARERMRRAGLADRVEIRFQDYRDVVGTFDKMASIEMFEAVGEEHWPQFFRAVDRCLAPGGRAAVQVITIADEAFNAYRRNPDFIQRYIFPGGMLPSPSAFQRAAADAGMTVVDDLGFGPSYAETLRRWNRAFTAAWPQIEPLGFDERFFRMWRYYLFYCEAGFEMGHIDVHQFAMERR